MQLTQVAGLMYDGDRGYNHRLVASNDTGTVIWHKYVGFIAQSGQNHVFIHGMRIKVSMFLRMKKTQQAALLAGDKTRIKALGLGHYDEQGTLWN